MANVIIKANEAPKKIYLNQDDSLFWHCRSYKNDIEYVQTDAFIEKARKWFEEHFGNRLKYEITTYEFEDMQSMIEDFKKYMEE